MDGVKRISVLCRIEIMARHETKAGFKKDKK
jgi:hypothetical protein